MNIDKKKDEEITILKNELMEMHKKIKDVFEENVNMRKQVSLLILFLFFIQCFYFSLSKANRKLN